MKIEFYINDKTNIKILLQRLAISLTLKSINTIYIDNQEYDLQNVRRKIYRNGIPEILDDRSDITK